MPQSPAQSPGLDLGPVVPLRLWETSSTREFLAPRCVILNEYLEIPPSLLFSVSSSLLPPSNHCKSSLHPNMWFGFTDMSVLRICKDLLVRT